jgi:hypothetical protein
LEGVELCPNPRRLRTRLDLERLVREARERNPRKRVGVYGSLVPRRYKRAGTYSTQRTREPAEAGSLDGGVRSI